MQFLIVTAEDGQKVRVNAALLEAWEPSTRGGSLLRFAGQVLYVTEPPDEIDAQITRLHSFDGEPVP